MTKIVNGYLLLPWNPSRSTCQQRPLAVIKDNLSHIEICPETDNQLA